MPFDTMTRTNTEQAQKIITHHSSRSTAVCLLLQSHHLQGKAAITAQGPIPLSKPIYHIFKLETNQVARVKMWHRGGEYYTELKPFCGVGSPKYNEWYMLHFGTNALSIVFELNLPLVPRIRASLVNFLDGDRVRLRILSKGYNNCCDLTPITDEKRVEDRITNEEQIAFDNWNGIGAVYYADEHGEVMHSEIFFGLYDKITIERPDIWEFVDRVYCYVIFVDKDFKCYKSRVGRVFEDTFGDGKGVWWCVSR